MGTYQRILCLIARIPRVRFVRWEHVNVTSGRKSIGNVNEEVHRLFTQRKLDRLHWWDGMNKNDWFMIYRDIYASRIILLLTMAIPVIGILSSKDFVAEVKDGGLWNAIKNTNIVRQMGILAVLPMISFLLLTYLALHLNAIRIHRIYVNAKDQQMFVAVISCCGIFTRKVPFTRHNIRILESASHQLWSLVKGSIKINKHRFLLHDEGFREISYRHQMLGRSTKPTVTAYKDKTEL